MHAGVFRWSVPRPTMASSLPIVFPTVRKICLSALNGQLHGLGTRHKLIRPYNTTPQRKGGTQPPGGPETLLQYTLFLSLLSILMSSSLLIKIAPTIYLCVFLAGSPLKKNLLCTTCLTILNLPKNILLPLDKWILHEHLLF